jgi:hypothetical protein
MNLPHFFCFQATQWIPVHILWFISNLGHLKISSGIWNDFFPHGNLLRIQSGPRTNVTLPARPVAAANLQSQQSLVQSGSISVFL